MTWSPPRSTKRALRIHHRLRMIRRAMRLWAGTWFPGDRKDWVADWALRNHDHMADCSCWMCGNPRRYLGLPTVQELRHCQDIDEIEG